MDWEFGRHLFSLTLKITDIFSVFTVLSFPEYYINGIIQLFFVVVKKKAKQNAFIYLVCFFGCARVSAAACRIFSGSMWDLVP